MKNWDTPKYQKISQVAIENDMLIVSFEDGTIANINAQSVLPPHVQQAQWNLMTFDAYELTIPTEHGNIEIPWSTIRVLSDEEYSAHLAEMAEVQAKKIGRRLKMLREKRGIKSKEVAERTGITPQSISRIENGKHDVSLTTLQKILAVMGYELKDLAYDETEFEEKSFAKLLKRIVQAGVDKNLALTRIIPRWVQEALEGNHEGVPDILLDEGAKIIGDIFGWSVSEIWGQEPLKINPKPALVAFFKSPVRIKEKQAYAYTAYAYQIAELVVAATSHLPRKVYPESMEEIKNELFAKSEPLTFEKLLAYIWNLGICVIPLDDSGAFHAASWNIQGRHVIILKQKTKYQARWLYDLLHDFKHVLSDLNSENTVIIEQEEISPFSNPESEEEREANAFANLLILDGRAEELAQKCVKEAQGQIELLKNAVIKVAQSENVGVDSLANYIAFRLVRQGQDWWGTANNLQIDNPPPITIAQKKLFEHLMLEKLTEADQALLKRALSLTS